MPRSTRELVNETIGILSIADPGQSVSQADYEVIKAKLPPLLAELKAVRVATIYVDPIDEDSADIPDHVFIPLAIALANEASSDFGLKRDLAPDAAGGTWHRLKVAVHDGPHGYTRIAEYF
jgi:hypothetical protein